MHECEEWLEEELYCVWWERKRSALPCVGGGRGVRCKAKKKLAISEAFDVGDNEDEVISKENCQVRSC